MQLEKKQLIFGRHPVVEAIKSGTPMDKVILQQGVRGEFEKDIRYLCKEFNIPLQVTPKERFNKFTRKNHQGILGFLALLPYYRLEDVLPTIYEKSETPLILILDGISDVRNFGAIARSAELAGVHALVISKKGNAQINAEAIKTSAGALHNIPVCREHSLVNTIDLLKMNGIATFASSLKTDKMLYQQDFTAPSAIIMGSEGEGVSMSLLQKVDQHFIIPQIGTSNSFNVSVATGIVLYEAIRQRLAE